MANFLKSLFTGKVENREENDRKNRMKNFELFKYDGLRAQRMRRMDYAIKCFTEALAIEEDFETIGYLSNLYIQTGELTKAHDLLKRMIELEPQMESIYLTLADVASMSEDYKTMADVCLKAIELKKDDAMAYYFLAKAYQGQNDILNAVIQLTQAIVLKEDYTEARLMRAELLIRMNEYKEAASDLNFVLVQNAEEEAALLLRGKLKEALGDGEGVEEDYRTVINLNPFHTQAYLNLGQWFIKQGRLTEAIGHLDETIELNPDCAAAYYERGRAKRLMGDKEGAVEDEKKSFELAPEKTNTLNGTFNSQIEEFDSLLGFRH
ncbi:Beta-barrel assembly-enhancing protease [termite gut metagenome]|uniref:Beta-barrel assembly-enhancing protease n=1 Tax=termite gut metagenome TaxID=433724 RepID=A0A5J4SW40_9ZZZZ